MIQIVDNVIPELYQDKIEAMMTNIRFPWMFLNEVTYKNVDSLKSKFPNASGTPGFAHLFYDSSTEYESQFWDFAFPLFLSFVGNGNFRLLRAKGGLLLPTKLGYNMPHIDAECPHTTALYYVNDSDGDTHFFDENENVCDTVTPKKGRLVIFDGLTYHASSCPITSSHRLVINFNYVQET